MQKIGKPVLWMALVLFAVGCSAQPDSGNEGVASDLAFDHVTKERANPEKVASGSASRAEMAQELGENLTLNEQSNENEDSEESESFERKIIREQHFRQQVQNLSQVLSDLEHTVNRISGAFIETMDRWEIEEHNRTEQHAQVVLRIPVDQWAAFEKQIEKQGNILDHHVSGQDVTEEYIDNDARLRNLKAHEKRILELYEKAETIEEMLKIEAELSRIRSSIEELEGRQKYLDQVTSTIRVSLDLLEVEEHEFVSGQSEQGLWKEAWLGFKDSLQFIDYLAQRSIVLLITLFPYLILLIIPVIIIFLIRKKVIKSRKKDQE